MKTKTSINEKTVTYLLKTKTKKCEIMNSKSELKQKWKSTKNENRLHGMDTSALVLGDSGDANVDSIRQNFDSIHCCYVSRSFIN